MGRGSRRQEEGNNTVRGSSHRNKIINHNLPSEIKGVSQDDDLIQSIIWNDPEVVQKIMALKIKVFLVTVLLINDLEKNLTP